jgi:hypothetical protein
MQHEAIEKRLSAQAQLARWISEPLLNEKVLLFTEKVV